MVGKRIGGTHSSADREPPKKISRTDHIKAGAGEAMFGEYDSDSGEERMAEAVVGRKPIVSDRWFLQNRLDPLREDGSVDVEMCKREREVVRRDRPEL